MDEPRHELDDWCAQARELLDGCRSGASPELNRLLSHIDQGIELRRPLDHAGPATASDPSRRTLLGLLTDLRQAADQALGAVAAGSPQREAVVRRARAWLVSLRMILGSQAGDARAGFLERALAIEGLRGDIDWLGGLIARLDRDPPPSPTATIEVELDRVQKSLAPGDEPPRRLVPRPRPLPDPEQVRLLERCEQLRGVLLERRVRRELRSAAPDAPEALLSRRLKLSRLQARVASMDRPPLAAAESPGAGNPLESDPEEWAESLAVRRLELADRAAAGLAAMDLAEARRPCERAAHEAQDEISEAIAFLEDMPLPRAVKRLELAREDLDQLTALFRDRLEAEQERPAEEDPDEETDGEDALADAEQRGRARDRLRQLARDLQRLARTVRGEWQEKLLGLRLHRLLGRRAVRIVEALALWLILALAGLIAAEFVFERAGWMTDARRAWFGWADLVICSTLLAEFGLRLALAPQKGLYFRRHFVLDFLASLPFGFVSYVIDAAEWETSLRGADEALDVLQILRLGRLLQVLRYARIVMPALRIARLGLFVLRLGDRLVRQHAGLLNRNIVLFESQQGQRPESGDRHRLLALRGEHEHLALQVEGRLDRAERAQLAARVLGDLEVRIRALPPEALDAAGAEAGVGIENREIPVEAVVDRLIQLSPERLIDRMGPAFVASADRYLRLLDVPVVRRLPIIRNLVAYRQKSPAEAVTLAANYLGNLVQRGLELVYFLADLQGTLSPAVFLDRLGATIVNATRTPARRLLSTGTAFLLLYLTINALHAPSRFRVFVDRLQQLLGWPVIVLGVICLGFWTLGAWFRKIANQQADFCERVAEAQFASQTKSLKSRRRDQDAQFLAERVIDPELLLRSSDDRLPEIYRRPGGPATSADGEELLENRELVFLRNIRLLYQDYLDGSPFHRSDTKASMQLLGNLALTNMRRSHLGHLLREGRALDRLDLTRAGRVLGGPYLWFQYITRMIVQETAILLLDYNRHAIPWDRLACASEDDREAFRSWLARRLRIEPEEIRLPELIDRGPGADRVDVPILPRRPEAAAFLETVEFTAMDFLADDPQRDEVIAGRFGPQVIELVRRDRQQNVRRAFRSFPLHELPLAQRTINPFAFYQAHLSRGRIVFLPFLALGAAARAIGQAVRGVSRVVHEILHPRVEPDEEIPADAYGAALRKIHRMRKPVFMGSLWLRARFDVEYLGLPLPTAPPGIAAHSLMEHDLDFIGATRQDRIIAEQIRRGHQRRLEWVSRWLHQFGWTFDELPAYLAREMPHLSNRGGEALRALVTACVLDHDDITSLGFSIEALKRILAHGADPTLDGRHLPPGLPDPVINLRKLWHPVPGRRRPLADLFVLPCFPPYDPAQQARIVKYLRRHRRAVRGWVHLLLGQGGGDPWAQMRARLREVLLRTDLWSDQMIVLRAVQTLTMLDVQHNCELVWSLGGYSSPDAETTPNGSPPPAADAGPQEPRESEAETTA